MSMPTRTWGMAQFDKAYLVGAKRTHMGPGIFAS
jgi:hypothetical protein